MRRGLDRSISGNLVMCEGIGALASLSLSLVLFSSSGLLCGIRGMVDFITVRKNEEGWGLFANTKTGDRGGGSCLGVGVDSVWKCFLWAPVLSAGQLR